MKVLVFLLILANLLFAAFGAGYIGGSDNPDAGRVEQQVAPERMRIVSRGEAPAIAAKQPVAAPASEPAQETPTAPSDKADEVKEPAKEAEVKAEAPPKPAEAPAACLVWDHLSVADADRLAALLGSKFGEYKLSRRVVAGETNGWWVSIPPQASKAEVDRKAAELKQLEIADFFVVQDGPNRNAISLGVFSSEKGGQERLNELKAKGVRTARLGPRPTKESTVRLQASGPAGNKAGVLAAVSKALPKAEAQACK